MRFRPGDPVGRNQTIHTIEAPAFLYFHSVLVLPGGDTQHRRAAAGMCSKNDTPHIAYPTAISRHQVMLVKTGQHLLHEGIEPATFDQTAGLRHWPQGRRDQDDVLPAGSGLFAESEKRETSADPISFDSHGITRIHSFVAVKVEDYSNTGIRFERVGDIYSGAGQVFSHPKSDLQVNG